MEMPTEMEVDAVAAKGVKRAASPDRLLEEESWSREEELRWKKAPKWNSREAESRDDLPPKVRELMHQGHMLMLRTAAARARSSKLMAEMAIRCPKAFASPSSK
ncbi:hypothetical protein ACP70R_015540 [Stipagrostis hirtigluma subsp. patula]